MHLLHSFEMNNAFCHVSCQDVESEAEDWFRYRIDDLMSQGRTLDELSICMEFSCADGQG